MGWKLMQWRLYMTVSMTRLLQYLHRKSTRKDMEFHVDFFIEMAMGDRELILDRLENLKEELVYVWADALILFIPLLVLAQNQPLP
jgi:hypothetical protein